MIDLLVKNAIIVTVNKKREIIYDGAIAVKDNKIIDIGKSEIIESKYLDVKKIIDADKKVVFPGFINTHTHLFQSLLKGLGDDMDLSHWLADMMFQAAIHLNTEDTYWGAISGGIEAIRSGVTTTVDYMHTHSKEGLTDGIVKAYADLKIRGIVGRGMINEGSQFGTPKELFQDYNQIKNDLYRLYEKYHNSENGRIKIGTAPSSVWAASKDMLKLAYDVAVEHDSIFAVHLSESPFNSIASKKVHGLGDFEVLLDLGITGKNVLMVHCVYLTEEQMDISKNLGMNVSHNVASNMYLASGVADIPKMLEKGLTIGLGVDGAASNNSQDMIETMKLVALQHKVAKKDPKAISAEKVLEMATIDGAKSLNMENEIGSLEIGKLADFSIFNPYKSAKAIPMHNPVSTLVYSSSIANIETVVIDGNIVMENSKLLVLDNEEKTLRSIQKAADELCERGNITNRMENHKWQ